MNSQITTAETTSSFQPGTAGIPVPEETTGEASRPVGTERKSKSQALCEQAINRLVEALEAGQCEAIKQYLRVMSHFHHYSFSNQLLTLVQRPRQRRLPVTSAGKLSGVRHARAKRPSISPFTAP